MGRESLFFPQLEEIVLHFLLGKITFCESSLIGFIYFKTIYLQYCRLCKIQKLCNIELLYHDQVYLHEELDPFFLLLSTGKCNSSLCQNYVFFHMKLHNKTSSQKPIRAKF